MPYILGQTIENLSRNDIEIKEVLADTNYSSGEALKYLEDNGIIGYIPCTSNYKPNREGFLYDHGSEHGCTEQRSRPGDLSELGSEVTGYI